MFKTQKSNRFTVASILFSILLFLVPLFNVQAQRTANEYVKPYANNFMYGANLGYYGSSRTDAQIAALVQKSGGYTLRPTLPEDFVERWGYSIRLKEFQTYTQELGMSELACFIEKPSAAHRDPVTYPNSSGQSKLFANMYEPIWKADGTVNEKNYYALYVYKLTQVYGNYVRFWEVWNEPDLSSSGKMSEWLTRAPLPKELPNTQAPLFHYIRLLRITWEVVKKYNPDAHVTTGGIGYTEYLDALLRYTDNPDEGKVTAAYPNKGGAYFDVLSYHCYPTYYLRYWDNSIGGFRYNRHSDGAAKAVIDHKKNMEAVLTKYGYNGSTFPKKHVILTETNISRRTVDWRYSSDEMQRNFTSKVMIEAQKNDIKQLYLFIVGEGINTPSSQTVTNADSYKLMGLYQNLFRDTPGNEKPTQQGIALHTTSKLLLHHAYDASRTAALKLPANVQGAAFKKGNKYVYALWAQNETDQSEKASATYSFPSNLNVASVVRHELDFSQTNRTTKQAAQNISLNGAPTFFVAEETTETPATPTPIPNPTAGSISLERWEEASGHTIGHIPLNKTATKQQQLTLLEAPTEGSNYGQRIRGYVTPPTTGDYTFFVAGDDAAELWLSTSEAPEQKRKIAFTSWRVGERVWTNHGSQRSVKIKLEAGKRYYIEVLHKKGWGTGHVAAAWQLPNGAMEAPIAGNRLSPFTGGGSSVTPTPTPTPTPNPTAGSISLERWDGASGHTIGHIPLNKTATKQQQLTLLEAPTEGSNYGQRIRGYVTPPTTGDYTFFVAGDDAAELWLSTSEAPEQKRKIAFTSWRVGERVWTNHGSQRSVKIKLEAGKRYYIEVLHKKGWGTGHVAAAWQLPNGAMEAPIAGNRLSPFTSSSMAISTTSNVVGLEALNENLLSVYPNPVKERATVHFVPDEESQATVELYDLNGRKVKQLFNGKIKPNQPLEVTFAAEDVKKGLYVVLLKTGSKTYTKKVLIE